MGGGDRHPTADQIWWRVLSCPAPAWYGQDARPWKNHGNFQVSKFPSGSDPSYGALALALTRQTES